jgi:two-component system, NtrC family, response regulator GlrR
MKRGHGPLPIFCRINALIGEEMQESHPDVLIWDSTESCCFTGGCKHLKEYLKNLMPAAVIHEWQRPSLNQCENTIQFGLIFFRIVSPLYLSDRIASVKKQFPDSYIIGVLCLGPTRNRQRHIKKVEQLNDFLTCPFEEFELHLRLPPMEQVERTFLPSAGQYEGNSIAQGSGLIGESRNFLQVLEKLPKLLQAEGTILLTGETGTGKELFARAIHYGSSRKGAPFIPVNCGALPDHLFENELFGHVKGAFTDASSEQKGLIDEAEGGTLFLDEIDSLSLLSQVKLLRFLQDHEYRPLGSSKSRTSNVRVLAATNQDLKALVRKNRFREDLYYRVNIFSLCLPPLRDRLDDIPRLAHYFLAQTAGKTGKFPFQLSSDAVQKLLAYPWFGNVRELETVIQRTVMFCQSCTIQAEDIDLPSENSTPPLTQQTLQQAKQAILAQFERNFLADLLAVHHGNVTHAARAAGTERRAFQRLLKKHHLNRSAFLEKIS